MRKRKLFGSIATFLMAAPLIAGLIGAPLTANAAELGESTDKPKEISITLHKKAWKGDVPKEQQNSGLEMDFEGSEGLNGVEFTMYDVTDIYYDKLAEPNTTSEAALNYIRDNSNDLTSNEVRAQTTSGDGSTKFEKVETTKDGKDRVLMFLETYSPATVTHIATPMVVLLPVMMSEVNGGTITWKDSFNTDVHLYPKNQVQDDAKKEITGDISKGVVVIKQDGKDVEVPIASIEKGMEINYQITTPIPLQIQTPDPETGHAIIQNFTIVDAPTEYLSYVKDSIVIHDSGSAIPLVEGTDYTVVESGRGFKITVNTEEALTSKKLTPGGVLKVTYRMLLQANITPDEFQNNKATINIGKDDSADHDVVVEPPHKVVSGGRKFQKSDGSTGEKLAGAEFILWKGAGATGRQQYAVFYNAAGDKMATYTDGEPVDKIVWETGTSADATKFVSTATGFAIQGLAYGTYELQEVKAPDGYALPLENNAYTKFDVSYGSYDYKAEGIANPFKDLDVLNTKTGSLPSTGGTGIIAFIVVGLGMMIGAYIWFKKSKRTAI